MFKGIVFACSWVAATAFATQTFGYHGSDGADARRGYDGRDGARVVLDVDGSSHSYVLRGEDGGDASGVGQDGSPAGSCQQPHEPAYNLVGASGGNGGDGARGGHGGDGGNAFFYLQSEDMVSLLKEISVLNPGGRPGVNASRAGRGAPGCQCVQFYWEKHECTWTFFRTVDGQKRSGWYSDQKTDCTSSMYPPSYKPYSDGDWELAHKNTETYRCANGSTGSNGTSGGSAQNGSYGEVVVLVGGTSKTPTSPSLTNGLIADVIGKTYQLSGYDSERREGLRSLVADDSDVLNTYWFRRYFERKVRVEWRPKVSPQDAGMADKTINVDLAGTASAPSVSVGLPEKLTYKVTVQGDTSVVTITHVLNTTDPAKIATCAKHNGKGSYVCGFSEQCFYEDGDCLPK